MIYVCVDRIECSDIGRKLIFPFLPFPFIGIMVSRKQKEEGTIKTIKWILIILGLLFLLFSSFASAFGLIGVAIYVLGMWLYRQKENGKKYAEKPWMFFTAGILTTSVLVMIFVDPVEEETAKDTLPAQQEKKEQGEEKEPQKTEEKASEEVIADPEAEKEEKAEQGPTLDELVAKFGLEKATVGRVVDGDTIETTSGQKIRFVGVNTPESTTRTETYGKEASNYTTSKLEGKSVWLQKDVSETDRYGRLLRIIWLDVPTDDMDETEIRAKMFNADLVLNGYAEASTYPPDVKYSEYFKKFSREARDAGTGLWAYGEEGTTKGDLDTKSSSKQTTKQSSNTSTTTTTTPDSSSEKEYFQNCTELRKKYPNGVPSTHPAYQSKMDRDHDNYACER